MSQRSSSDDAAPGWQDGVLSSLYQVAFATPDREVAGVLVGAPGSHQIAPTVQAVIPASEGMQLGQASQFSHQTWSYIHDTMARHYPGLEVVGWYLARPSMDAKLLEVDLANHQRWFGAPRQILLALDSQTRRGALYQGGPDGLVRLHEGPVAQRQSPQQTRSGPPMAAVCMLAALGVALGTLVFLLIQVLNTL